MSEMAYMCAQNYDVAYNPDPYAGRGFGGLMGHPDLEEAGIPNQDEIMAT